MNCFRETLRNGLQDMENMKRNGCDSWLLTAVQPLLVVRDNVVMSVGFQPIAYAEGALNTADEVGVLVGVLAGLVEHTDDLLAACRCLQKERQQSKQGILQSSINQLNYFSNRNL